MRPSSMWLLPLSVPFVTAIATTTGCMAAVERGTDRETASVPTEMPTEPAPTPTAPPAPTTPSLPPEPPAATDVCPRAGSISWAGRSRFWAGANYAWTRNNEGFSCDFGGISAWNRPGVAQIKPQVVADFKSLKANGMSFVRWFVFPTLISDAFVWGVTSTDAVAQGVPTKLTEAALADLDAALDAAEANVYLVLTLFSFDGFREGHTTGGRLVRPMSSLVRDADTNPQAFSAVQEGIVASIAKRVDAHPARLRVASYDIINEPEWATATFGCENMQAGDRLSGKPVIECLSYAAMHNFIGQTAKTLRNNMANSKALITVGSVSSAWASRWATPYVGQDYFQFHYYAEQHRDRPYTNAPSTYGLTGKPVVVGEFPGGGFDGLPVSTLMAGLESRGYAGGWLWSVSDRKLGWDPAGVKSFVDTKGCSATMNDTL